MKKDLKCLFLGIFFLYAFNCNAEWRIFDKTNSPLKELDIYASSILNNDVYFVTGGGQIIFLSNNTWNIINDTLNFPDPRGLKVLPDTSVWIGGVPGAICYKNNIKIWKISGFSQLTMNMYTFIKGGENIIYIGGEQYIYKMNLNDYSILRRYDRTDFGVSQINFYCSAKDSSGNILFGTSQGLIKFTDTSFSVINNKNSGLNDTVIISIAVDKFGHYWLGTESHGIYYYDGQLWKNYTKENSAFPTNDLIFSIKVDSANNKWFALAVGVSTLQDTVWTNYTPNNSGLPSWSVLSMEIDKNNNKWFATRSGIVVFNETGVILSTPEEKKPDLPQTINYPNPSNGSLNLDYTLAKPSDVDISLYTQESKFVRQYLQMNEDSGNKHVILDLSGLTQGIYYCVLKIDGKVSMNKIIKID